MVYFPLCLLLCCYFVDETFSYFTEINPVPTFSDWAIIPYTLVTYGRVVYKVDGRCFLKDEKRNLAPEGEQLEFFKFFLKTNEIYVDKSPFIAEILNDRNNVIRILRPPRWGKTLNLNMLEKFLEIEVDDNGDPLDAKSKKNLEAFCGQGSRQLQICNNKNSMSSFGKHPVISISLKGIRGNGYKEVELGIRERITTAFQKHYYLKKYLDANETLLGWGAMKDRLVSLMEGDPHTIDMLCSIQFLSELLYNHHGNSSRVYVLIDDFDSPVINAFSNFGHNMSEFKELLDFMQGFLSMGINDNEFLEKVVITGTYHLYMDDEFAGLANITEYNMIEDAKYAKYFGFNTAEVKNVLEKGSLSPHMSQVEKWYGGYVVGSDKQIYHPGSVMEFVASQGKFDQYGVLKANESLFVYEILSSDEIKTALKKALDQELDIQGDETDIEIDPAENYISKSIVLLCNGIFTHTQADLNKEVMKLKLPNEEVREFVKKFLE